MLQSSNKPERSRLAAAARPEECEELAPKDVEVDTVNGCDSALSAEVLPQAPDTQDRLCR